MSCSGTSTVTPALLTSPSRRPHRCSAAQTRAAAVAGSPTSPWTYTPSPGARAGGGGEVAACAGGLLVSLLRRPAPAPAERLASGSGSVIGTARPSCLHRLDAVPPARSWLSGLLPRRR